MAEKRLEMLFRNASGRTVRLVVNNAKDNLTEAEIQNAMNLIIAKNIFNTSGGDLVSPAGARVISSDTVEYSF